MEKQRTPARGGARGRTTSTGEIETGFSASPAGQTPATGESSSVGGSGTNYAGSSSMGTSTGGSQLQGASTPQGGMVGKVKERATAQLSSQKGKATEGLDTIAQAVRHTTQQLRADDHGAMAEYIDKAAEQLERFSSRLREKDVNELLRDAQQLARRQPAVFIGGSFALGLLAARFIKSSQRNTRDAYRYEGEAGFDRYNTGAY